MTAPIALALPDPCLVVMVGPAGAGKSTLAHRLVGHRLSAVVVSYDGCREELAGDAADQTATPAAVALAHRRIADRCAARTTTVVDATHTAAEHRRVLIDMAAAHQVPVVAVAVWTSLSVCLARQFTRVRQVPAAVVAEQHAAVAEALGELHTEGYAQVHVFDGGPARIGPPSRVRVVGDLFHGHIPAGAFYVGRGAPGLRASRYANPHKVGDCRACGREHDQLDAVHAYTRHLIDRPDLLAMARRELAGIDLACWCRLDSPCHADVLLDLINGGAR